MLRYKSWHTFNELENKLQDIIKTWTLACFYTNLQCSSGVEYHYLFFLLILLLMSYFILVITSVTGVFMSKDTTPELQI